MRRLLAVLVALTLLPSAVAHAAATPSGQDPCSSGGRDRCGTLGAGRYGKTRYGTRWFGDFRNAVRGFRGATFDIDLRWWYPRKDYEYRQDSASDGIRNRRGQRISMTALHRMNYAIWTSGRTRSPSRQAAAMLYVHHLMDDVPRGAITPRAVGAGDAYLRLAKDAKRHAGPYEVAVTTADTLTSGTEATLRVKVTTKSGVAMPGTTVALSDGGDTDLPDAVRTGSKGTATVTFTPTMPTDELRVVARAEDLAAPVPDLYLPTHSRAGRNATRLVGPDEGDYRGTLRAPVATGAPAVTMKATPALLAPGGNSQDELTVANVPASWRAQVEVRLFGPAPTAAELSCTGTADRVVSYEAGPGVSLTPALTLDEPGFYAYGLAIPPTDGVPGTTTACPDPDGVVEVRAQP